MTDIYNKTTPGNMQSTEIDSLRANVWVNANIDGTFDRAYNVSSLTDIATGKIGVSFTNPFLTSDYVIVATPQEGSGANFVSYQDTGNLSTSRSDFWNSNAASTIVDPTSEWNIYIIGD